MKHYPSISTGNIDFSRSYYVFDKIDGSNIRAEWSAKKGFHKFGSRKVLLSESSAVALAKNLILAQSDELTKGLKELRIQECILFFEFFGDQSFAGIHSPENDNKRVYLLDVDVYKQGMLDPKDFLKIFASKVLTPDLLCHGFVNRLFLQQVEMRTLPGMTYEGIVGKSFGGRQKPLVMFKHKSEEWKKDVSSRYGEKCDAL